MKNVPKEIFLQVGDPDDHIVGEHDFNELVGVTWCIDKIHLCDIPYIRKGLAEVQKRQYGRNLVDTFRKFLVEHGYCDYDIINEFKYSDFEQWLNEDSDHRP